jgi:excisionase family DNA binding protein
MMSSLRSYANSKVREVSWVRAETSSRNGTGKLLTMAGAAERLNVNRRYIKHLLYERRLDRVKIGKLVRIPEAAIDNLISSGYRPASGDKTGE